jgi:photosystem II stability/assembly factor-like uncharacterized protein
MTSHRLAICMIALLSWAACADGWVRAQPVNDRPFTVTWPDASANRIAPETLWSVAFADASNGWVVGIRGTILATHNGGQTWERQTSGTGKDLNAVRAVDAQTAWVVGDGGILLATHNGGQTWDAQQSGTPRILLDGCFVGKSAGWVVGEGGTILMTHDGGAKWMPQPSGTERTLYAVQFALDGQHGWAVGVRGTILLTTNGGAMWEARNEDSNLVLDDVSFADSRTGWIVGQHGTVLSTHDGGYNWEPQTSTTGQNLTSVRFVSALTGWAVGDNGTIIATRDGGHTWEPQKSGTTKNLLSVGFDPSHVGWAVGDEGTLLRSSVPIYAPWVEDGRVEGTDQVHVSFFLHTQNGASKPIASAEARIAQAQWNIIGSATAPSEVDRRWHMRRDPAEIGIHPGDAVEYRVILNDGGPQLAPVPLGTFTYDPWFARVWRDDKSTIALVGGLLTLLAVALAALGFVFWFAPARLACMGSAIGLDDVPKPGGNLEFVSRLAMRVIEHFALPWLCRHPRVRRAWIERYRKGESKISDLCKSSRESFLGETDVLDEWVARHVTKTRSALNHLDLFEQRLIYVPLDVRVGDRTRGKLIEGLSVEDLRPAFNNERTVVSIIGGGGGGKSTLACAIARWAIADDPDQRPAQHQMLPVFVTEETTNLVTAITRTLHRMFGDEELPDDLIHGLLARQRLLVIVDALSELGPETQAHIEQIFAESVPINAIVLTSRIEPRFGALDRTTLYPMLIDATRIVQFISDYLDQIWDGDQLKDGRTQLRLGERVLTLAQSGGQRIPVTPLLVTLCMDSAVQRVLDGQSLDEMPEVIPEVFIDYLRRLNASAMGGDLTVADEVFSRAAQILATVSVAAKLVPQDFAPDAAIEALEKEHVRQEAMPLIERLVASGLLERRMPGGILMLRFTLDPVAEYLAVIDKLHRLQGAGPDVWDAHIAELYAAVSSNAISDDYLVAFGICYRTYQKDFVLPAIHFPWEHPAPSHAAVDA